MAGSGVTKSGDGSNTGRPRLYLVPKSGPADDVRDADKARRAAAPSVDVAVGREITRLRESRGMSLKQLSLALGIPVKRLKICESGQTRFASEILLRAAQIFGVKPSSLFSAVTGPLSASERPWIAARPNPDLQAQLDYIAQMYQSLIEAPPSKPDREGG